MVAFAVSNSPLAAPLVGPLVEVSQDSIGSAAEALIAGGVIKATIIKSRKLMRFT
jgi:hypothetical protein